MCDTKRPWSQVPMNPGGGGSKPFLTISKKATKETVAEKERILQKSTLQKKHLLVEKVTRLKIDYIMT